MIDFSEAHIESLIKGIESGKINKKALPENLYNAIANHLKKGLYKGFGIDYNDLVDTMGKSSSFKLGDLELLAELRTNIYMFSAAKTYQQVREMSSALINDEGVVVPYTEFKNKARDIFDRYNESYLKTEYDTAVGQGQNAIMWNRIENEKEVLPLLKYDAVIDKNTSDICRPLDGLVAPVDDPVWKKIMPLNHFNCRCLVRQLTEGEERSTPKATKDRMFTDATGKMSDVFKMNPGIDQVVFKEDHPYFIVPKEDQALAKRNFNLSIPKKD